MTWQSHVVIASVTEWKGTEIGSTPFGSVMKEVQRFEWAYYINNHNNIFWGADPPEEVSEISLKVPKSTCFCALNAR